MPELAASRLLDLVERFGAALTAAPTLSPTSVALAAERQQTIAGGIAIGLTEHDATEVVDTWLRVLPELTPRRWLLVRSMLLARRDGGDWHP